MTDPQTPRSHGATIPVPAAALFADDFELYLAWAPLTSQGTSCRYEACESDEACTCQEGEQDERAA